MPAVTTQRAAESSGMTVQGVHVLIREGRLQAEKLGRDHLPDGAGVERVKQSRPRPGRPSAKGPAPKRTRRAKGGKP